MDPYVSMAVAGSHTSRVKVGTVVTDAVRRHPAIVAQTFLSLDHITKGRVILGIGAGETENTEPYGIEHSKPVSKLEEALKIIRLLWENEGPVSYDGQFWKLKDAILALGPYEPGKYPPIWLGAFRPRMLSIVARLADGWFPTYQLPQEYGEKLAFIKKVAAENGRDLSNFSAAMSGYFVVAESHEDCHRLINSLVLKGTLVLLTSAEVYERYGYKHPLGDKFYGVNDYIPTRWDRELSYKIVNEMPFEVAHHYYFHGTAEEVAESILEFVKQGLNYMVVTNFTTLADRTKARVSYEGILRAIDLVKQASQEVL